jgi:hypothetical protein
MDRHLDAQVLYLVLLHRRLDAVEKRVHLSLLEIEP